MFKAKVNIRKTEISDDNRKKHNGKRNKVSSMKEKLKGKGVTLDSNNDSIISKDELVDYVLYLEDRLEALERKINGKPL